LGLFSYIFLYHHKHDFNLWLTDLNFHLTRLAKRLLNPCFLFVYFFLSSAVQAIRLYWYPRAGMDSPLSHIPTEARSIREACQAERQETLELSG